jgi:uncharacterized membrane protein
MEPNDTPMRPPQPTKADSTPAPTDAELSRIAREAVRQPADPRLDKQLERMGLTDAPAPAPPASPSSVPVASDPTVEALGRRLRRLESIVWVLAVAVVVLAVAVVVLLIR